MAVSYKKIRTNKKKKKKKKKWIETITSFDKAEYEKEKLMNKRKISPKEGGKMIQKKKKKKNLE